MTHQKRYTAEELIAMANRCDWTNIEAAAMLRQAAHTESQVAGLVDALYSIATAGHDPTEDVWWSARRAREALSKFRGEA